MKREQIIKMLENKLWGAFKQGQKVSPFDADNSEFWAPFFYDVAISLTDAILALPLDVPSDNEIKDESINKITEALESVLPNDGNYIITDENKLRAVYFYFQLGAIWMHDEILKRN